MLQYRMRIGGQLNIGYATSKSDGTIIYAFRQWGKLRWSGDGENLRKTKTEAFADARNLAVPA